MIEHIKTYILIGLVGLSIVLTWQNWTYKPLYDYLLPTEYVEHEGIAERREISDLIRPEKIIYHFGDDRHTASYPEELEYANVMKQQMKNWSFNGFREIEQLSQWDNWRERYEGIELIYPTNIPLSTFKELFRLDTAEQEYPDVSSIFLYINPIIHEVYALFVNYDEQRLIRANTTIPIEEMEQYLALGENRPEYGAVTLNERAGQLQPALYFTEGPVQLTEYRYFYKPININTLLSYLFVDSSLVRQIQDRNGETFFTDGTRGLQLNRTKNSIQYVHPFAERPEEEWLDPLMIQRSVQFVNQHRGWEPTYYLHQMQSLSGSEASIQFRRYLNRYPVYDEDVENEQNVIQLEVQEGRVVGYNRSLLQLDVVMEQVQRELPAAFDVLQLLEEENIALEAIKSLDLGYVSHFSELFNDRLVYRPVWVIQWQDGERSFVRQLEDITGWTKGRIQAEEEPNELE